MDCCKTKERKTHRDEEQLKSLLNRLNRIEGQIRGIKKMLEEDSYCSDVILQVAAAKNALDSLNKELMTSHIHSCLREDLSNGNESSLDELSSLLERLLK